MVQKIPFQLVKNPPAMQETWVRSLGWEDALEEGMAILPRESHRQRALSVCLRALTVHGVIKTQTRLSD